MGDRIAGRLILHTTKTPLRAAFKPGLTHQTSYLVSATGFALCAKFTMDLAGTVDASTFQMHLANQWHQGPVTPSPV
jgi:hypothetical protein